MATLHLNGPRGKLDGVADHGSTVKAGGKRSVALQGTSSWLDELRSGSCSARAELFVTHEAHVQRVLVGILGADHEIPDLLQEVFMVAFIGVEDYRGDEKGLRFWLAQIAVNRARLCIRGRLRRGIFLRRARTEPPQNEEMVENRYSAEAMCRARMVLERIPTDERIPLSLAVLEGRSLPETAELCRVSLATVKRRLQRGRQRLARLAASDPVLQDFRLASD